ncbi:MAG: penicillin acylase family protein [Balneolaceae bacterium]|nr:penicillin acylase family protein [Balneolaceae bacterium]
MQTDTRNFTLTSIGTLLLFWVLSISLGPAPPMGPFMNPNSGFWANAVTQSAAGSHLRLTLEPDPFSLSGPVRVYYDEYDIPHIFAETDPDLYFAQGYVTARDRLWQMELQTHAAAGRLSEILGPQMLELDRFRRRIGMVYSAERALERVMEDPESAEAVEAYTAGVNAWIDRLDPAQYPLEYKILDYAPEPWTPLKVSLLLKNMTYTLASNNNDVRMSNTRAFLGTEFIEAILDLEPEQIDPIIPPGTEWNFDPLEPRKPTSNFTPSIVNDIPTFGTDPNNGSNNWAVSGSKTASGFPILANDPHLNMTLPSIWYAVQLHSPTQNVMGVSLPGAPTVIIGFNEHIAWGSTNVSADVWDWYEIEFRDSTLSEYRYDGKWRNSEQRIEQISVKGKAAVSDTVVYTHHGPVINTSSSSDEAVSERIPKNHAVRWMAYEESNELKYFLEINRAGNYDDYRRALTYYHNPAQNWIFADSTDIAITVTGKYPLKWEEQGRYISDGSNPLYEWQGWIPFEQIPSVKNPERGFVSSANQDPVDSSYPYYLDDDFAPYERGKRINDRLAAMDRITAADMQQLQLDDASYHAQSVLPAFLEHLERDTLDESGRNALDELNDWDYHNDGSRIAPSLFKYWWEAFEEAIWSDEYGTIEAPLARPDRDQVAHLVLNEPELRWYDDIETEQTETLADLINHSFYRALRNLEEAFGPYGDGWRWGYVNDTDIRHIARIPGLGRNDLFTDGGAESVNAIRGGHGPSWRMVVELGPEVKARGIYPGGQSGNPGSPLYDNMIDDWNAGTLYPLWFMRDKPAADSVKYILTLN